MLHPPGTASNTFPPRPTCSSPHGGPASSPAPVPNILPSTRHPPWGPSFCPHGSWITWFSLHLGDLEPIFVCASFFIIIRWVQIWSQLAPQSKNGPSHLTLITSALSSYFLCRKWRHLKVRHGCLLACSAVGCLTSLPRRSPPQDWRVYLLCTLLWLWYLEQTVAPENSQNIYWINKSLHF